MRKLVLPLYVVLILACIVSVSFAGDEKRNVIAIGSHGIGIDNDAYNSSDDRLYGGIITYQSNIAKFLAFRLGYYADEHEDYSYIDARGFEGNILLGTNFTETGANVYLGVGFFYETIEVESYYLSGDFDVNGYQISLGCGYNWDRVAFDIITSYRSPENYEDEYHKYWYDDLDLTVVTASVSIGYRF